MGAVSVPVPPGFRDLSLDHTPLGTLSSEKLSDQEVWIKYRLSSEQIERFWKDGYLSNIRVLNEEQCEKILAEYDPFLVSWCQVSV